MIRVAHLINDTGIGGVNRMIDVLLSRLDNGFVQSCHLVRPGPSLPPAIAADVIVIHFTTSWNKLGWMQALRWRNAGTP